MCQLCFILVTFVQLNLTLLSYPQNQLTLKVFQIWLIDWIIKVQPANVIKLNSTYMEAWMLSCGHVFRSRVRGAYQCVSHAKICPLVNISFRRATHTGITYPQDVTYAGEARHDALLLTAVAWTGGGEGISIRAGHHHHHHHHRRHYHHRHHHHIITRRWGGHQQQSQASSCRGQDCIAIWRSLVITPLTESLLWGCDTQVIT